MCVIEQWYHVHPNGTRELQERQCLCDQRNLVNHHSEIRMLNDSLGADLVEISPRRDQFISTPHELSRRNKGKSRSNKKDLSLQKARDKGRGSDFKLFNFHFPSLKKKKDEKARIMTGQPDKKVDAPGPSRPLHERPSHPYARAPEPKAEGMRRNSRDFEQDSHTRRSQLRAPSPDVIVVEPSNLRDDFRQHVEHPPSPRNTFREHQRGGSRDLNSLASPKTPVTNGKLNEEVAKLRTLRRNAPVRNRTELITDHIQRVRSRQEQENPAENRQGRTRRGSEDWPRQSFESPRRPRSSSRSRERQTSPRRSRSRSCDGAAYPRHSRNHSVDRVPPLRRSNPSYGRAESPRVHFEADLPRRPAATRRRFNTLIHQDLPPTRGEDFGTRGDRILARAVQAASLEPVSIFRTRSERYRGERRVWEDDPHRNKERYI